MNVLFHYTAGPDLTARLAAVPGLRITICPEDDEAALARALPESEVLWHVLKRCTEAMIAAAPKLKLIQKIGVGVNTINLDAAIARGIPVCNLPGTNARAVAELTLALMLAVLRRVPRFDAGLRGGVWLDPVLQDGIGELGGRDVGLVGYGADPAAAGAGVGRAGMQRDLHRAAPDGRCGGDLAAAGIAAGRGRYRQPACAVDRQTANLIDAAALARMKPGAILMNTARGGLVDQAALAAALRDGRLAAAGLDVFEQEPTDPADPLLRLPNVVLTPHIAWLTTGTFDRSFSLAAENCRRLAAGEALLHRVV